MRILIYEDDLSGHRLEFLHHYYVGALSHKQNSYVFYVPTSFKEDKDTFIWPEASHISWRYFTSYELSGIKSRNIFIACLKESLLLRKKIKEVSADKVFLTTITIFIPFIVLLLNSKTKISGILYNVSRVKNATSRNLRNLFETLRYNIAVNSNCIDTLFILNDMDSCSALNAKFKTDKFHFLVDPSPDIYQHILSNLREQLSIPYNNTIYLHFGGMAKRKGTLEILQAILLANKGEFKNKTFIFAGKIYDDIHNDFYSLLDKARRNAQIIIFDEFCSYELLYNLCYTTNVILMPYKLTTLSSGVLGYASAFDKMVIGPSQGLIGNLIKKYHIGLSLENVSAKGLYECIQEKNVSIHSTEYSRVNSLDNFIYTVLNVIS